MDFRISVHLFPNVPAPLRLPSTLCGSPINQLLISGGGTYVWTLLLLLVLKALGTNALSGPACVYWLWPEPCIFTCTDNFCITTLPRQLSHFSCLFTLEDSFAQLWFSEFVEWSATSLMDFHCTCASGKCPKIPVWSPICPSPTLSVAVKEQLLWGLCDLRSVTTPFVQDEHFSEETTLMGQQGEDKIWIKS